ncbi:MAG: sugar phosphate isomerase/epimerase [Armatimonadetes bacterium]|nr:sugar phosphate isomerase/epimerase [Armatimonadota bacterium]
MLHSGLVSITFRKLPPGEIVDLVKRAGLEGIEWGGDIHVPHGQSSAASEVRRMTEDAGLRVAAFGSYYRVGHEEPAPFEAVLETAAALGAPTIRVWAGKLGSEKADAAYREQVTRESRRIADLAAQAGVVVATEYHGGTLTDTAESAVSLLQAVGHDNLKTYWQPPTRMTPEDALETLRAVLPWLNNIHAFWWVAGERRPLAEGAATWQRYLREARRAPGERYVMLEFVRDDSPEAFLRDAEALRDVIRNA